VASGMQPLMQTDSEQLMQQGIAAGVSTFAQFLNETQLDRVDLKKTICHQVGSAHRKLMLESLRLDVARDFATLDWLGNTGSVALPITMAIAAQRGWLLRGDHVGMLGIGSGINCIMLAVHWQNALVGADGDSMQDLASVGTHMRDESITFTSSPAT
jgi:acyl-CoA:acyl-CoA alkyltransferase